MLKMKSTAYALVLFCVSLLFCNFTSRADVNSYVPDTQVQFTSSNSSQSEAAIARTLVKTAVRTYKTYVRPAFVLLTEDAIVQEMLHMMFMYSENGTQASLEMLTVEKEYRLSNLD
jgi:hypothetical protein